MSTRIRVLTDLLTELRAVLPGRRAFVALDGVDGSGEVLDNRDLDRQTSTGRP